MKLEGEFTFFLRLSVFLSLSSFDVHSNVVFFYLYRCVQRRKRSLAAQFKWIPVVCMYAPGGLIRVRVTDVSLCLSRGRGHSGGFHADREDFLKLFFPSEDGKFLLKSQEGNGPTKLFSRVCYHRERERASILILGRTDLYSTPSVCLLQVSEKRRLQGTFRNLRSSALCEWAGERW